MSPAVTPGGKVEMGLFKKRKPRLRGTARVVSATQAPHNAAYGNMRMTIVVEVPGVAAYTHELSKIVRVTKWPHPGQVLPVAIDPDDLRDVDVLWDEVPTGRESARQRAEQMAAHLNQQGGGAPGPAGDVVSQLQQMFPGATVSVGGDPAGAGVPGPPGAPGGMPPVNVVADRTGADPVERLEKLARLRDAGIVDQAQFEQLKAQILGQAGLDG